MKNEQTIANTTNLLTFVLVSMLLRTFPEYHEHTFTRIVPACNYYLFHQSIKLS